MRTTGPEKAVASGGTLEALVTLTERMRRVAATWLGPGLDAKPRVAPSLPDANRSRCQRYLLAVAWALPPLPAAVQGLQLSGLALA